MIDYFSFCKKQTGFSKKYWKQLKAERARNNAENDLENKRVNSFYRFAGYLQLVNCILHI